MENKETKRRSWDIAVISIFVILFTIVSYVTLKNIKEDEEIKVSNSLQTIRNTAIANFKLWKKQKISDISYITRNEQFLKLASKFLKLPRERDKLVNNPIQKEIRNFFKPFLEETGYIGIFLFTRDSVSLTSMRDANIGKKNFMFEKRGEILEKVFNGEIKIIPPIASDVPIPGKKGNLVKRFPTMFVAAPVKINGRVEAVFTLRINLNSEFSDVAEINRIGNSGETYAVDKDGYLISNSRFLNQLVEAGLISKDDSEISSIKVSDPGFNVTTEQNKDSKINKNSPLTLMAKSLTKGETGINVSGYNDYRGIKVIGAWQWDDELNLGIVTEIDAEEAYQSYEVIRERFLILGVIILLLTIFAVLILVRRKKESIQKLEEASRQLEIKVEERTQQLKEYSDKLKLNEDRFRKYTEYSNNLLTIINKEGEIVYDSSVLKQMLGFDSRNGEKITNYIHSIDKTKFRLVFDEFVNGKKNSDQTELRIQTSDKRWKVLSCYMQNFINDSSINGIMINSTDITDKKDRELIEKSLYNIAQSVYNFDDIEQLVFDVHLRMTEFINHEVFHIAKFDKVSDQLEVIATTDPEFNNKVIKIDHTNKIKSSEKSVLLNHSCFVEKNDLNLSYCIPVLVKEELWGSLILEDIKEESLITETLKIVLEYISDQLGSAIEKINAATEYEEAEERLKLALRATKIGVWTWDIKNNLIIWDERMCEMFGLPVEIEKNYQTFISCVHPDDIDRINKELDKSVKEGIPYDTEYRIIWKDGSIRYIDAQGAVNYDENQNAVKMSGVCLDITERKTSENKLIESETRLKQAQEIANLGSWSFEVGSNNLVCTDEVFRIFGLEPQSINPTFENFVEFVHPEDYELVAKSAMELAEFADEQTIVYRIVRDDQSVRTVKRHVQNIKDQYGVLTKSFGTIQDITELVEAEKEIQESQKRLKLAIDSANAGTFYWDLFPDELQWDQRIAEIFELDVKKKKGILSTWEKFIHPEDKKHFIEKTYEVLKKKKNLVVEFRIKTKRNNIKYVECNGYVISNSKDEAIALSGIFFDITNRKMDEKLLEESKIIAEQANRAKSEFLARMSHELRTPLNGILGYAQILKKDDNFNKEQRKGLEIIEDSGKHLLELINDILDLSKIEARKFELDEREFELVPTIESVTNIIQIKTKEKNIKFINRYDTVMPKYVLGDPRALKQILLNLLGNAVKFTEEGSVSLISSFARNKIKIDIIDTGVGIENTDIKNIFNPFEQSGKKVKSIEGTGLGLAITEKLVNLMDGQIKVESRLGEGSTFSIELSLTEIFHTEDEEKTLADNISGYKGEIKKILVVDDKQTNLNLLQSILSPIGFKTIFAENGKEAIERAKLELPDLILMDIIMPVMDGIKAAEEIKKITKLKTTPIIAISASVHGELSKTGGSKNFDDYIPKPFLLPQFFEMLKNNLKIEWIYNEVSVEKKAVNTKLILPDEDILERIIFSAEKGDFSSINIILEELEINPDFNLFLETVHNFVKNYDEDSIVEFIKNNRPG